MIISITSVPEDQVSSHNKNSKQFHLTIKRSIIPPISNIQKQKMQSQSLQIKTGRKHNGIPKNPQIGKLNHKTLRKLQLFLLSECKKAMRRREKATELAKMTRQSEKNDMH